MLALAPASAAEACGSSPSDEDMPHDDATAAETIVQEAAASDDALDAAKPGSDARCAVITEILDAGPEAGPDADLACRYVLPCGISAALGFELRGCDFFLKEADDGGDAATGCWVPESEGCVADAYVPPANGSLTIECLDCFGGGRLPLGLAPPRRVRARSQLGAYFARLAHDEAASVHAFTRLEAELRQLGAPAELVRAASRSSRDEEGHARAMAGWARAFGGIAEAPVEKRARARSREAIARENAIQGCVYETYGALMMRWQAAHATSTPLRELFSRISADETRHAALSWSVARWLEPRLPAAARARVSSARARAVLELRERLGKPRRSAFDAQIGRPSAAHAVALLDGLLSRGARTSRGRAAPRG